MNILDLLNRMEMLGARRNDLPAAFEIAGTVAREAVDGGIVSGSLWEQSGPNLLFAEWAWGHNVPRPSWEFVQMLSP